MTATTTDNPFAADIAKGEHTAVLAWRDRLRERADEGDAAARARLEFCEACEVVGDLSDPDGAHFGACECVRCLALRRYYTLLREHEAAWRASWPCVVCGGDGRWTGMDGSKEPAGCFTCVATGDRGGLLRTFMYRTGSVRASTGPSEVREPVRVHWRAGLPYAVECRLEDVFERVQWLNNQLPEMWRPTAWALAVAKWHPVTEFRITDREPFSEQAGECRWVGMEAISRRPYNIPLFLWRTLEGGTCRNWLDVRSYPTPEDAKHALAVAAGVVVRRALEG